MTNQMIVFMQAQKLAEEGKIGYTGRTFKAQTPDGKEVEYKETEPIHTYNVWKSLGYQVQKGQKSVAQFTIWKHTAKRNEETGEEENSRMFMKMASFFSQAQVEKVGA